MICYGLRVLSVGVEADGKYYLHQATKVCRNEPYDDPASNAALYSVIAELYLMHNEVRVAERMYAEYCLRLEEIFGKQHLATSDCYNVLSAFYTHQGEYPLAVQYCGKALIIRVEQLGTDHQYTADSHYNLGLLYRLSNKLPEAVREFGLAKSIRTQIFSAFSLEVSEVELSLGFTYHQQSNLDDALVELESSYKTRLELLGAAHEDTMEALNLLNAVRLSKGLQRVERSKDQGRVVKTVGKPKGVGSGATSSDPSLLDLFYLRRIMLDMTQGVGLDRPLSLPRELQASIEEAARKAPLDLDTLVSLFSSLYPYHINCIVNYIKDTGKQQSSKDPKLRGCRTERKYSRNICFNGDSPAALDRPNSERSQL